MRGSRQMYTMATMELVSPITSATNTYGKGAWVTGVGSTGPSLPGERHRQDTATGNQSEPHTEVPTPFLPRAQAALRLSRPSSTLAPAPRAGCPLAQRGYSPRRTTG